jgi:hypothetical protein
MGAIYLIQRDDQLVEMQEQEYDSENLLQELLAKYPNLLAGDQMDSAEPRRWLFIAREVGLPSQEESVDRWSVDHLFLDQDSIPTLIEVKRSSDTRIRREVVGQMLDYAANAVAYWPVERIHSQFEANCALQGIDPAGTINEFLGLEGDPKQFWGNVKTNLQAGRIRMIFVADEIPPELQRIVEFLNEQMDPAEVLAVEIKQYVDAEQKQKTLVPRVIGQTSEAQQKKGGATRPKRQWDEASFFEELRARVDSEEVAVALKLLEWARDKMSHIEWGKGAQSGAFIPALDHDDICFKPITVWTTGSVQIRLADLVKWPPFNNESKRFELRERLNRIPSIAIPTNLKYPNVSLSTLKDDATFKQFLEALEWAIQEVKMS